MTSWRQLEPPVRGPSETFTGPTASLDRSRSQEIVGLLAREAHTHGVATVMVTHDHAVLHHCDRVLEMTDGTLGSHAPTPVANR